MDEVRFEKSRDITISLAEYNALRDASNTLTMLMNGIYMAVRLDYTGEDLNIDTNDLKAILKAVDWQRYENALFELKNNKEV